MEKLLSEELLFLYEHGYGKGSKDVLKAVLPETKDGQNF